MTTVLPPDLVSDNRFGGLLRSTRRGRQVSQLELSAATGVSTRHLSFIETGRAKPSRDMVLRLCEELKVSLREQNTLLAAAGYTKACREFPWDAEETAHVRTAIDLILESHLPYPAAATDRMRNIVRANAAIDLFLDELPSHLRDGGANVFRLVLHPDGLGSRLVNFPEIRLNLLQVLERSTAATGDPDIAALFAECRAYPDVTTGPTVTHPDQTGLFGSVVLPVLIRKDGLVLSFVTVVATLGAAADTAVGELALELQYPANDETAEYLAAHYAKSERLDVRLPRVP